MYHVHITREKSLSFNDSRSRAYIISGKKKLYTIIDRCRGGAYMCIISNRVKRKCNKSMAVKHIGIPIVCTRIILLLNTNEHIKT